MIKKFRPIKNCIVSVALVILLWQILFQVSHYDAALFPSPKAAFFALIEMIKSGELLKHIKTSMIRFSAGYLSAVLFAVILGLILGRLPKLFQYINPAVQLLRPISPTAWMPFIVLLFGIGDIPAIVIIFIAAFFPVLLSTVAAVSNIDPIYFKISKSYGITQPALTWKVIFPAAFPQIANGIHLALGTAWIFLVAGEMVGAQSGLGYAIIDARNNIRADVLLATILVIGVLGILLDGLLRLIEKQIFKSWGAED